MPEETTVEAESAEAVVETQVTEETQVSNDSLETWKKNARKWEQRAKADAEAAAAWREYEAAQKPIQERLAEELAATKAEAQAAKAELIRLQVAAQKGITGDAARLLKGESVEELEAEADILLSLINAAQAPRTPAPDTNQGKPSTSGPGAITDPRQLETMTPQEIMKAKNDGRLDALLRGN